MSSQRFADKVVLLTGAGGGQGRVASQRFAAEGARVFGTDIDADGLGRTRDLVEAAGGRMSISEPLDITDHERVAAWVDGAAATAGGIDVVYNNAGAFKFGGIDALSTDDWRWSIERELDQVFYVTKAAWPHLVARGGGVIVNVGSTAGLVSLGGGGGIAHSATKAAVIAMTRDLAVAGGPHGIRAVALSPGSVESHTTSAFFADPAVRESVLAPQIIKRLGTPDDIVNAALFLASDDAAFVTGTNIVVDGGYTSL